MMSGLETIISYDYLSALQIINRNQNLNQIQIK